MRGMLIPQYQSLNKIAHPLLSEKRTPDMERYLKYKLFSKGFAYPGDDFFLYFPELVGERERIEADYDLLFRRGKIWLYTTEHTALGEFQKIACLSDIMGFYRAFGLEPEAERPDSLSVELEFMHYLIFKKGYAMEGLNGESSGKARLEQECLAKARLEKASLCLEAQNKFFNEYLYPGAKAIGEKVLSSVKEGIYPEMVREMLSFLEGEKAMFNNLGKEDSQK